MTGRQRRTGVIVGVLLVVNVGLLMSDSIAIWWRDHRYRILLALPGINVQRARRMNGWDNADVHVLMWALFTIVLITLARNWRQRSVVVVAVFMLAVTLEMAQPLFTARGLQGGDIAGNAVGVTIGGGLGTLVGRYRSRRLGRGKRSDDGSAGLKLDQCDSTPDHVK